MTRQRTRLGDNLKQIRKAAGLSQPRLASAAGVSPSAIARIEQGVTRAPREHELQRIADALDTTPDILHGVGDQNAREAPEEPADTFHHELARRYGPENAEFVDAVARAIKEFPPRDAAFIRNLLMGAVHGARNPWRNSPCETTDIGDLVRTLESPRTYQ